MDVKSYNAFCKKLPHTSYVVQWGGAHVWKVAGKVFAIGGWNDEDEQLFITFKCSDMSYDMLKDMPGCRPAPYLASRGMKWIQHYGEPGLSDDSLKEHIKVSYDMIVAKLTKKMRAELGI